MNFVLRDCLEAKKFLRAVSGPLSYGSDVQTRKLACSRLSGVHGVRSNAFRLCFVSEM